MAMADNWRRCKYFNLFQNFFRHTSGALAEIFANITNLALEASIIRNLIHCERRLFEKLRTENENVPGCIAVSGHCQKEQNYWCLSVHSFYTFFLSQVAPGIFYLFAGPVVSSRGKRLLTNLLLALMRRGPGRHSTALFNDADIQLCSTHNHCCLVLRTASCT